MANAKNGNGPVVTTHEQESTYKASSTGGKGIFENADGPITNLYMEVKSAKLFGLKTWKDAEGMTLKITLTLTK